MITIAKLDEKKRLVGYIRKEEAVLEDLVVPDNCDLQTDGSYEWTGKTFRKLGHGYGKVLSKPPISTDYALYLLIDQYVRMGDAVPIECELWHDWYKKNLALRNSELSEGKNNG